MADARAGSLECLIDELGVLRESMLDAEARLLTHENSPDGAAAASARNLAHFLALRSFDLRGVQERLAALGLSSLGRAEPQVLASVDRVLGLLHLLAGRTAGRARRVADRFSRPARAARRAVVRAAPGRAARAHHGHVAGGGGGG